MSQQLPSLPWIHIGECPFCVNGLCRVRYCDHQQGPHLYAMCDECEAMWLEPTTDSPKQFPDAEHPKCPICAGPLYGDSSRWAEPQDLKDSPWQDAAIYDLPSADPTPEDFLTPDDYAGEWDGPPVSEPTDDQVPKVSEADAEHPRPTVDDLPYSEPDIAYGDDEPRPGC